MIIHVETGDFEYARETCPRDAPLWMVQEFAANRALRRAFPQAEIIKVFRAYMELDGARFHRSLQLYVRRGPYRFYLSRSKVLVRMHDFAAMVGLA